MMQPEYRYELVQDVPDEFINRLSRASVADLIKGLAVPAVLRAENDRMWLIYADDVPFMLIGVLRHSLCTTPEIWLVVTEDMSHAKIKAARRFTKDLLKFYPCLCAYVDLNSSQNLRFAKLMGMTEKEVVSRLGEPSKLYELQR